MSNQIEGGVQEFFQQQFVGFQVRKYYIERDSKFGNGSEGTVHRALSNQFLDRQICAKIIEVNNKDNVGWNRELLMMIKISKNNHRNLLQILDAFMTQDDKCILIMEQQESNLRNAFDQRKQQNSWFNFDEVIKIIKDLLCGLFELHNNNIIHRDLKPENILIGNGDYKIADFGISKYLEDMITKINQSTVGTEKYFSPQIFDAYYRNNQAEYSSKTDIYSLGLIFYQLAFEGQLPWLQPQGQANFIKELKKKTFQVPQVKLVAEPEQLELLRSLIQKMLNYIEKDRPTWQELLTHNLIFQQNQIDQQTSYTKLIYNTIESQLTQTLGLNIKNLEIQAILNHKNNLKIKFNLIIILQTAKCLVAEIIYKQLRVIIHKIPELDQELISTAINTYIGFVYCRLKRIFSGEFQQLSPYEQQFYYDNQFNQVLQIEQINQEFLQLKTLIDQQYFAVKDLLLKQYEKLQNINQVRYQEYLQLIQAQNYDNLFHSFLQDFIYQANFYQMYKEKLKYVIELEEKYPLHNYLTQSIGMIMDFNQE